MALINFSKEQSKHKPDTIIAMEGPKQLVDARSMGIEDLLGGMIGCVSFITKGQWSLYDFLVVAVQKLQPAEVYISTYSMTELSARVIGKMVVDGLISKATFIMDYKAEQRYPGVHQILRNIGTVHSTKIHAKLCVIRNVDGICVTLIGSANWTKNPRIEAGVLDFSPVTGNAFIDWFKTEINGTDTGTT